MRQKRIKSFSCVSFSSRETKNKKKKKESGVIQTTPSMATATPTPSQDPSMEKPIETITNPDFLVVDPSKATADASKPPSKKRPSYFEAGKKYNVLILKNFSEEAKEMVIDALYEFMAEAQEESGDDAPDPDMDIDEVDVSRVRILLSEDQKKLNKTNYRMDYVKREEVVKRRKERENDETLKRKRGEYSKDPIVKERKAFRTKMRQTVNRELKKTNPKLYKQLEDLAQEALKQKLGKTFEPPSKRRKVEKKSPAPTPMEVETTA